MTPEDQKLADENFRSMGQLIVEVTGKQPSTETEIVIAFIAGLMVRVARLEPAATPPGPA